MVLSWSKRRRVVTNVADEASGAEIAVWGGLACNSFSNQGMQASLCWPCRVSRRTINVNIGKEKNAGFQVEGIRSLSRDDC